MKKKAVALRYEQEKDKAPCVIAKAKDSLAEKILEIAQKYHIPLYHDPRLADTLYRLDLGEYIPEEFYHVVAAILAWVYSIDKKEAEYNAKRHSFTKRNRSSY